MKLTSSVMMLVAASCLAATGCARRPLTPTLDPSLAEMTIRVVGRGAPPANYPAAQARVLAERQARMDAQEKIAERVYGIRVSGSSTVRDAMMQSDRIRSQVDAFLRGVQFSAPRFNDQLGVVEIDATLHMGQDLGRALQLP